MHAARVKAPIRCEDPPACEEPVKNCSRRRTIVMGDALSGIEGHHVSVVFNKNEISSSLRYAISSKNDDPAEKIFQLLPEEFRQF